MSHFKETDLMLGCASPEQVTHALRKIAERYREDAAELRSAHQDQMAGRPWTYIATNLERTANVMAKRLKAMGYDNA